VRWSDDEREEFLAGIEDEARRLDRVVGDLLSASRIEAGTLRPVKDWHDVGDLVDDVVGRLRSRAPRHRIVVDVADDLPPAKLDRMEIAQALGNLIENATKYASDGTEVVVSARLDGDAVLIQVSDRGPGVSADAARRIFEPFERAAREGTAGSGLGLAVAKSFVEAHGGRIWIEPRTGGGSTFAFTLPRTA
jgi:two-component system sensor histidine kinase KdpD